MRSIEVGHRGLLLSQIYVLKCQQQQSVSQSVRKLIFLHIGKTEDNLSVTCAQLTWLICLCVCLCAHVCVCVFTVNWCLPTRAWVRRPPLFRARGCARRGTSTSLRTCATTWCTSCESPTFPAPLPPLPCACILKTCVLQVCVGFGFGCVEAESQHKYPPPSPAHLSWKPKPSIHSLLHLQIL